MLRTPLCDLLGIQVPIIQAGMGWDKEGMTTPPELVAAVSEAGYELRGRQLVDAETGTVLVGEDSFGPIECLLEYDQDNHALYKFARAIDRAHGCCARHALRLLSRDAAPEDEA